MVYTGADGDGVFEWDDDNEGHVARHGVEWWEAEEALLDPDRANLARVEVGGETRFLVIGRTGAGRLLCVVYVVRRTRIRVVTARRPTERESRRFRRSQ
ncbi:MAG: BrnT family toxin [Dehalococcoidia bacterium]